MGRAAEGPLRRCRSLTARSSWPCERGFRIPLARATASPSWGASESASNSRRKAGGRGGADWNLKAVRDLLGDGPGPGSLPVLGRSSGRHLPVECLRGSCHRGLPGPADVKGRARGPESPTASQPRERSAGSVPPRARPGELELDLECRQGAGGGPPTGGRDGPAALRARQANMRAFSIGYSAGLLVVVRSGSRPS